MLGICMKLLNCVTLPIKAASVEDVRRMTLVGSSLGIRVRD